MDNEQQLSVGRNIKIGFFHLGSGMSDVITTGVWNRIMISDLGFAATPIGLLVSLRYFLAPLGVWSGRLSDERTVFGYRRLFWIWIGRLMMLLSIMGLGFVTAALARGAEATIGVWVSIILAMFLFSMGTAISGSTFLALIYDRSNPNQRGRAVGIVWTFLLLGFTVGGILFALLLPAYDPTRYLRPYGNLIDPFNPFAGLIATTNLSFSPDTLQNLFIVAGLVMGSLWFFSLLGEEKRQREILQAETQQAVKTTLRQDLSLVWRSHPLRFFCAYLALSMAFAFSQDLILEPFAAEVFGMSAATTSRFAAYWGSMSIVATLAFLFLSRRYRWFSNLNLSNLGILVLMLTFGLFAISSFAEIRPLVTPGLILLGLGLGIWNVGTLGLMMDMSPYQRAGTFLGFWTLVVTLARGLGVSSGGILRDLSLALTGATPLAYGLVFTLGAIGLGLSYVALLQIRPDYARAEPTESAQVFAASMD